MTLEKDWNDTPPEVPAGIPWTASMSREGYEYLQAFGINAIVPPLRSSDFGTCLSDPFAYYMARRLGVVPAVKWSKALNRGTWMHLRFQHYHRSIIDARERMESALAERLSELSEMCKEAGMVGSALTGMLEREERDMRSSLAWYEAARDLPCLDGQSFEDVLLSPRWHRMGTEFRLVTSIKTDDRARPIRCICQPDLLLYNKEDNTVWIVDLKTTGVSPKMRLTAVPVEFQCEHYMFSVNELMKTGQIQKAFKIPQDATLGGMMHLAIRKPTIEFGMKDRDYTLDMTPLKSGPRKGLPRNTKVYEGEPRFDNYLLRCNDWYHSRGDYADKEAEWAEDPPVNISVTKASLLVDPAINKRYRDRVRLVQHYAICDPYPENFPMPDRVAHMGRFSTYSPFMLSPVGDWPSLIQSEGFTLRRRDDPIPEEVEFDVISEPGSEFEE
jgi:hypothetical protein